MSDLMAELEAIQEQLSSFEKPPFGVVCNPADQYELITLLTQHEGLNDDALFDGLRIESHNWCPAGTVLVCDSPQDMKNVLDTLTKFKGAVEA